MGLGGIKSLQFSKDLSFDENIAASSAVATIYATDSDAADTHIYSLVSGSGDNDNNTFSIKNDQLKINGSPDYEIQPSYSIRLQTTDNGGLSHSESFTLSVNDLADNSNPQPGRPFPDVATIFEDEITLQFPDELGGSNPSELRFRITINGQKATVLETNVEPSLGMVFLTLNNIATAGASVILNYSDTNGD